MTKIQRVTIILAAFGIVSILLTQVKASNNSQPQAPATMPVTNLHINTANGDKMLNRQTKHTDNTTIVTNIYQSASGSFYFEKSNTSASVAEFETTPLNSTKAEISITGPIARTRLSQVFENTSDHVKSGVYVFPLPQDAAVDHLLMQVGDRKIEGQIKRKEAAHKMYTQAKAQGKKASLVSQLRPNMFTNKIANIPPHSKIVVTIEYQQFIKQDKYNYSLRLPLSITPRYSPTSEYAAESAQDPINEIDRQNAQNAKLNDVVKPHAALLQHLPTKTDISIRLNTGLPVNNISSEHHPIKIENPFSTEYQIELDTKQIANKDFVLHWQLQPSVQVQASHFTYHADNYEYGLITLMPPAIESVHAKRNLVFILDVSGSMVGDAIAQAKQALALAIEDLQDNDYFNIVAFSSSATRMWSNSQLASEKAKQDALSFIYELEANGGTEIKKALDMAFAIPTITNSEQSYLNQIIFITDGSISNEDQLLQNIYQNLGNYRLFTVGIGSAPNAFFMTEAATAGKGSFTFIGDIASVKPKMHNLLDKLKRPALTNIKLNIKDAKQAFGFEIYPSIIPDLYAGEPLVLSYRRLLENNSNSNSIPFSIQGSFITKTAQNKLQARQWSSHLPSVSAEREQGIHKHWARLKIKDLHQQLNRLGQSNNREDAVDKSIAESITKVALNHHLVSKYTSLIAIDHSETHIQNNSQGTQRKLAQYAQAQLPQTATPSALLFIIGFALVLFSIFCLVNIKRNETPTTYIQI